MSKVLSGEDLFKTIYLDLSKGAEQFEFDEKVVSIDAWYDRHTRDYCIQLLNEEGYQVGDAIRVGNKADKESTVKRLREEYGL